MLDERFDGTQTSAEPFGGEQLRAVEPLSRMPRPEQFGPDLTAEGRVEGQEIEAGTLLILACAVGWSFARMWKPGMNDIPHSGCLPLEEYLLERTLPLEADETFTVCGRPWLTLK